ncbi:MAG: hypothetical protein OXH69_02855 [Acidobacteria bacterium]|nr:hypothetical protein [Acidobacteriota bacterium]
MLVTGTTGADRRHERSDDRRRDRRHHDEQHSHRLERFGGVGTAQRLLKETANRQYGFEKLRRGGHLHVSVENLVLLGDFPTLFRKEELDEARRRLRSVGVNPEELARELEEELRR